MTNPGTRPLSEESRKWFKESTLRVRDVVDLGIGKSTLDEKRKRFRKRGLVDSVTTDDLTYYRNKLPDSRNTILKLFRGEPVRCEFADDAEDLIQFLRDNWNQAEAEEADPAHRTYEWCEQCIKDSLEASQENDPANKIDLYNGLIEKFPNIARLYVIRGWCYAERGKSEEAQADYLQALAIDPSSAMAHKNLGVSYYKQKAYAESLNHLTRALSLKEDFLTALAFRACAYAHLGDSQAALADINRAEVLMLPVIGNEPPFHAFVYFSFACCYATIGDPQSAIKYLKRSIRLDFDYGTKISTDKDFDRLRGLPEFDALTGAYLNWKKSLD